MTALVRRASFPDSLAVPTISIPRGLISPNNAKNEHCLPEAVAIF